MAETCTNSVSAKPGRVYKRIGLGQVYTRCKELGHIASVWERKECTIILRAIMKLSPIKTQNLSSSSIAGLLTHSFKGLFRNNAALCYVCRKDLIFVHTAMIRGMAKSQNSPLSKVWNICTQERVVCREIYPSSSASG